MLRILPLAFVLAAACVSPRGAPAAATIDPAPARCTTDADCPGSTCEGEGCAPGQGRCAPAKRMCTRDLVTYCGCDGKTFRASGNCPGRRYAHRGWCDGRSPPSR